MKNKYERITLWLTPKQIKDLKAQAKRFGMSASALTRDLIQLEIQKMIKSKNDIA